MIGSMDKATVIIVLVLVLVMGGFFVLPSLIGGGGDVNLDAFAQCLAGKGATMYGSASCPHCQNEKQAFGDAFHFIPYVECSLDPQECIAKDVDGVPTWIFADGKRLVGEQGLERLSAASGCELPQQ